MKVMGQQICIGAYKVYFGLIITASDNILE